MLTTCSTQYHSLPRTSRLSPLHAFQSETLCDIQPGYATREVIAKAKNLKACITAGVGSDHIDLNAANEKKLLVAEVTGSNVVSVAEHVIMTILLLVRNYNAGHLQALNKDWNVAGIAKVRLYPTSVITVCDADAVVGSLERL